MQLDTGIRLEHADQSRHRAGRADQAEQLGRDRPRRGRPVEQQAPELRRGRGPDAEDRHRDRVDRNRARPVEGVEQGADRARVADDAEGTRGRAAHVAVPVSQQPDELRLGAGDAGQAEQLGGAGAPDRRTAVCLPERGVDEPGGLEDLHEALAVDAAEVRQQAAGQRDERIALLARQLRERGDVVGRVLHRREHEWAQLAHAE